MRKSKVYAIILSAMPIALGILKAYAHFYSPYRSGPLDYLVAAGLIVGGLLVHSQRNSKAILLASFVFIIIELYKASTDYSDYFDLFLTLLATLYLSVPIIRYFHAKNKS